MIVPTLVLDGNSPRFPWRVLRRRTHIRALTCQGTDSVDQDWTQLLSSPARCYRRHRTTGEGAPRQIFSTHDRPRSDPPMLKSREGPNRRDESVTPTSTTRHRLSDDAKLVYLSQLGRFGQPTKCDGTC